MMNKKDKIAEAYDETAWWYNVRGYLLLLFAYNTTLNQQLRFFGSNMKDDHLELACGNGLFLKMALGTKKIKVTGVDYSQAMLNAAVNRLPNVALIYADITSLDTDWDNKFNSVSLANALHCLPYPAITLKEAYRVLKPEGHIVLNALLYPQGNGLLSRIANKVNAWGARKKILVSPFTKEEVDTLLKDAGFTIGTAAIHGNSYEVVGIK